MTQTYDIAIIGGGLAGLTQAILLARQGWHVACIDREDPSKQMSADVRTTAISWGARNLLLNAGIWQDMAERTECIRDILILDEDSPVELAFNAVDIDAEGFGWIVDNRDLRETLLTHIKKYKNLTHITGVAVTGFDNKGDQVEVTLNNGETLTARLIIGADGRHSFTREAMGIGTWRRDYKQSAVVCMVEHSNPHNGMALEHFRAQGPFAVLPFTDDKGGAHRSAVVWSVETDEAPKWLNCSEDVFNVALQTRCGDHYTDVRVAGSRTAWPLTLVKSYSYIADRMVLVAEAAHGMHPIAGQGLNMSLRDLAALTEVLDGEKDPGDMELLKEYQRMRRADNVGMVWATDKLNLLFGTDIAPVRAARRFGLDIVSRLPFAKRFFMRQAMGAVGHLPALIREVG